MLCFRHSQHARDHSLVLLAGRRVVELTGHSQLLGVLLLGGHCVAEYSSVSGYSRVGFEISWSWTASCSSSRVLGDLVRIDGDRSRAMIEWRTLQVRKWCFQLIPLLSQYNQCQRGRSGGRNLERDVCAQRQIQDLWWGDGWASAFALLGQTAVSELLAAILRSSRGADNAVHGDVPCVRGQWSCRCILMCLHS